MGYPNLNDLEVYKLSNQIANQIYKYINTWEKFYLYSLGNQLIRSVDSIAANISEGYGRYFFRDNIRFCYYARGSLYETKTWIQKSYERELISEKEYVNLNYDLNKLSKQLNAYINYLYSQLKK